MPLVDPEKYRAYQREYQRMYRAKYPDRAIEVSRKTHEKHKEKRLAHARAYKKKKRAEMTALQRKRHCAKLLRTPKWADALQIAEIYKICAGITASTGVKCEVDHDMPLQGKLVSGLHVHQNLVIRTKTANLQKGNKWQPSR